MDSKVQDNCNKENQEIDQSRQALSEPIPQVESTEGEAKNKLPKSTEVRGFTHTLNTRNVVFLFFFLFLDPTYPW